MSDQEAFSDQVHAAYMQQRQLLTEREHGAYRLFDQLVVTIAGGTLAGIAAFLKDYIDVRSAGCIGMLLVGCLCLAGAFVTSLLSLFCEAMSCGECRDHLDMEIDRGDPKDFWNRVGLHYSREPFTKLVKGLNVTSVLLLLIGMLSVSLFLFTNIRKEGTRGKETVQSIEANKGGASTEAAEGQGGQEVGTTVGPTH